MIVGVVGLGLIGGSFARAYAKAGHTVYAYDKDQTIASFAQLAGIDTDELTAQNISRCDFIILSLYAEACNQWLESNAKHIHPAAIVMDCCGIKQAVCQRCFPIAEQYGFTFVGGHPMAGSHNSGFKYSRANLFQGAPMVLVPPRYDDPVLLQRMQDLLLPCGFKQYSITTAQAHDQMIAFTSQMPHILSNAFIKSPTALQHQGFSAGSYKDLTRVAWLNPVMWAELFMINKENILQELDYYISSLQSYRDAIDRDDQDKLIALLDEGRRRKEEVDG